MSHASMATRSRGGTNFGNPNAPALFASPASFKQAALSMGYGTGFANAMEEMINCEGNGHAKNEGDGGGITFCGLTTKNELHGYSAAQCDAMTMREVLTRYHKKYWSDIGLDTFQSIAPSIAFRCFDANVNSGGGGLSHMLTWVVSRLHIPVSGRSSQDKMHAIADAIKEGKISEDAVHKECENARVWFYRVRCASKWGRFGRGWMNRLKKVAHRVAIIRGQSGDDGFDPSSINFDQLDQQVASNPVFTAFQSRFSAFMSIVKGFLKIPDSGGELNPDGTQKLTPEQGEKLGADDSRLFTNCFGAPKETYNPNCTQKAKEPIELTKIPLSEGELNHAQRSQSLETVLIKTSQDREHARLEAKKKSKEGKEDGPWWSRKRRSIFSGESEDPKY